jgi:hypothetical protein
MRCLITLSTATMAALLILPDLPAAQEPFKSGLEKGRLIGGPFLPSVVSGKRLTLLREFVKKDLEKRKAPPELAERELKRLEDVPYDPVTEFGNHPVVGVFIRESAEPKTGQVSDLLAKLDTLIDRNTESFVQGFAILLTRAARSAVTEKKNENIEELIAESKEREELRKRLTKLGEPLKNVVLGSYPYESLKGYEIADAPGVTILVYHKHKVLANYAFAEGQLNDEEVEKVIKGVDSLVKTLRRRPREKS